MFFRTVRFRLTLWYVLTLAVILAASGFFWHLTLSGNLLTDIDKRLHLVGADVASFYLETQEKRPLSRVPDGTHCPGLEDFLHRRNWSEFIQVLDGAGNVVCLSSNFEAFRLPLKEEARQAALGGAPYFETLRSLRPDPLRLLTLPARKPGGGTDFIQVGVSLAPMEEALHTLRLVLLTFSPLVLTAVFVGGWFLAGRALSPVVRITRAAQKIKAENLSQRLPVGKTEDEIGQLTETFNSMLARLEDSFRKIKQFSGDASHELRTPLTILKGETEVALRWAKSPEEFRQMLQSNLEEIDRMDRIIENLLALAKSEVGERPLEIEEFSLSDLLQDLYLQGKALGEPKEIAISLRLKVSEEIRMKGDQPQLQRLFLNLITNGIKYCPRGGRVEISLALQGEEAVVAVADTGIGIAEEHLPHIFDRFYRVDEARNREVGGTGLGLAIVKSIAEAHGGRVTIESTPGVGSVFTVYLPLEGGGPQPE